MWILGLKGLTNSLPWRVIALPFNCLLSSRKYKPITTYEQRCSYKRDFQAEYRVYEGLKEKVDSVSTKFTELQNKRQQFPEGSEKRKVG